MGNARKLTRVLREGGGILLSDSGGPYEEEVVHVYDTGGESGYRFGLIYNEVVINYTLKGDYALDDADVDLLAGDKWIFRES